MRGLTSGEQDFKTDKHTFVPVNFLIYRTFDASMIKLLKSGERASVPLPRILCTYRNKTQKPTDIHV